MTVAMAAAGRGVGFEVGKDRLLLARAASFVRMKGESRVEDGERRSFGKRGEELRVSLWFGGGRGRHGQA